MSQTDEPLAVVVATRNAHKAGEIRALLGEGFRFLTLSDCPGAPKTIEDADTFPGNATKKAVELARWLAPRLKDFQPPVSGSALVLADDSGLEVDALGGAPGVHSARFAALDKSGTGNSPDADNNAKLLQLLQNVPPEKRTARFHCVIALVRLQPPSIHPPRLFDGTCEGWIDFAPRGHGGFGYDPLFVPQGFTRSFAELGEDTKNQLSHRARALAQLRTWLGAIPEPGQVQSAPI
jgi:XTP/dITP diphosphohydrolase